jgi:transcriptional regulator with XRE-family HTH domain
MLDIFIHRLKMLRNSRGLTQELFAQAINCSREAVASYETGKSTPPVEVLIQMADFLQVSLDYLVGRSQTSKMESPNLVTEGEDLFSLYYKLSKDDQIRLFSIAKAFEQDFKSK